MRNRFWGMTSGLLTAAALAAGTALAGQPAGVDAEVKAPEIRMSAAELNAYLSGEARSVPDNCVVHYSPFTGECMAVVCTGPTGGQALYECSEFGL